MLKCVECNQLIERNCQLSNKIIDNETNDLILNLTPENVTQHSRIE